MVRISTERPPSETDLDLIWRHLAVPVDVMRGYFSCPLCDFCGFRGTNKLTRHGQTLGFGHFDIRAVGPDVSLFGAPGMVYHYMAAHHYTPPALFLSALRTGPTPPEAAHFAALDAHGVDCRRSD